MWLRHNTPRLPTSGCWEEPRCGGGVCTQRPEEGVFAFAQQRLPHSQCPQTGNCHYSPISARSAPAPNAHCGRPKGTGCDGSGPHGNPGPPAAPTGRAEPPAMTWLLLMLFFWNAGALRSIQRESSSVEYDRRAPFSFFLF